MNLVNLTPHVINVHLTDANETKIAIAPSGTIARVQSTQTVAARVNGIEIVQSQFGQIDNLPEPESETIYIVSSLVAQAARGRDDAVAPDTGPTAVRDIDGKIVAVRRFQTF